MSGAGAPEPPDPQTPLITDLDHVPGTYVRLGVAPPGAEASAPSLHTSQFDIDERALAVGVRTLVHAVLAAQRDLAPA